MDYSYKIDKLLPKSEFMVVTYTAAGYPRFRKTFNPIVFDETSIHNMITNFAPVVIEYWERQADHPEETDVSINLTGSNSASAPVASNIDWSHAPTVEAKPDYDRFTQYITKNQIEDPMQETVGWTIHDLTAEQQASYLEDEKVRIRSKRDGLLYDTDWMMFSDTPTPSQEWLDYRRALRDVTDQATFPTSVTWPTKPE